MPCSSRRSCCRASAPISRRRLRARSSELHLDGARAFAGEVSRRKWRACSAPDVTARKFWAIALGVALEGQGMGRGAAEMSAAMREALGEMAEMP